jgi:hypothetical protein
VELFQRNNGSWEHETSFNGKDGRPGRTFGGDDTLALEGDILAAGAEGYSKNQSDSAGAVFLYRYDASLDAWKHVETLIPPDPTFNGGFGHLDLDGTTLAVGEPYEAAGRVHIYEAANAERMNWSRQASFAPVGRSTALGASVEVDNGTVLAGAPFAPADLRGPEADQSVGAAYWYHHTPDEGWSRADLLRAPVPNPREAYVGNRFGEDVALTEGTAAVGGYLRANHRVSPDEPTYRENITGALTLLGPDMDGDHLADGREIEAGTPPGNADPDGDGALDGLEIVRWLTDPFDPDHDGDGLEDGAETNTYRTQPFDADTDGDLVSDGLEADGLTVANTSVVGTGDPNDHTVVPSPLGPTPGTEDPFVRNRRDYHQAPPVDRPCLLLSGLLAALSDCQRTLNEAIPSGGVVEADARPKGPQRGIY